MKSNLSQLLQEKDKKDIVEEADISVNPHTVYHDNKCPIGRLEASRGWKEIHGFRGNPNWDAPFEITQSRSDELHPSYISKQAHEYEDDAYVLSQKISLLCELLQEAKHPIVYTGAGIGVSSGLSSGKSTKIESACVKRKNIQSGFDAQPTLAHRALVSLYQAGFVHYWVQQNHDGLPQKAGFPQKLINEIHGAWYDPSNPVVSMSGSLRGDLFEDLVAWEDKADLTLAMGTNMCGMSSDRVFEVVASRSKRGLAVGGIIISTQRTQYDHMACLRIFAKLDDVMQMLLLSMGLYLTEYSLLTLNVEDRNGAVVRKHVFRVPYDSDGLRIGSSTNTGWTILNLEPGSRVKITGGPYVGDSGDVLGCTAEGHYRVRFSHTIADRTGKRIAKQSIRMLGLWWVEAAIKGDVPKIPIVSRP